MFKIFKPDLNDLSNHNTTDKAKSRNLDQTIYAPRFKTISIVQIYMFMGFYQSNSNDTSYLLSNEDQRGGTEIGGKVKYFYG